MEQNQAVLIEINVLLKEIKLRKQKIDMLANQAASLEEQLHIVYTKLEAEDMALSDLLNNINFPENIEVEKAK